MTCAGRLYQWNCVGFVKTLKLVFWTSVIWKGRTLERWDLFRRKTSSTTNFSRMRRDSTENQVRFWAKSRGTWAELCSWESYGPACCFGHGNFPRESLSIYVAHLNSFFTIAADLGGKYSWDNLTGAAQRLLICRTYETLHSLVTRIIQTSSCDLYAPSNQRQTNQTPSTTVLSVFHLTWFRWNL